MSHEEIKDIERTTYNALSEAVLSAMGMEIQTSGTPWVSTFSMQRVQQRPSVLQSLSSFGFSQHLKLEVSFFAIIFNS